MNEENCQVAMNLRVNDFTVQMRDRNNVNIQLQKV